MVINIVSHLMLPPADRSTLKLVTLDDDKPIRSGCGICVIDHLRNKISPPLQKGQSSDSTASVNDEKIT